VSGLPIICFLLTTATVQSFDTHAVDARNSLGPLRNSVRAWCGGIGEVYRAHDTRLDRTVTIKILPAHLSSNGELNARFEREARTASTLNHPHICHMYDIGSQDATSYMVMEFLEGESLANRLRKGALPLKQTLQIGVQIADALSAAHAFCTAT
jgi:serine/threonine protein kinase